MHVKPCLHLVSTAACGLKRCPVWGYVLLLAPSELDLQHAHVKWLGWKFWTYTSEATVLSWKRVVCSRQMRGKTLLLVGEFRFPEAIGSAAAVLPWLYWCVVLKQENSFRQYDPWQGDELGNLGEPRSRATAPLNQEVVWAPYKGAPRPGPVRAA